MAGMKKILAPTDFSDLSKLGIRHALEMARDMSAEVIVYHAVDVGGSWKTMRSELRLPRDVIETNRKVLGKFLRDHFADCMDLVEVRQMVEFGAPDRNIVEVAEKENVDLIVMSTHGRTGIDHVILGSVTEKVVARAPCPVLVVPRREQHTSIRNAA